VVRFVSLIGVVVAITASDALSRGSGWIAGHACS
jgi:hypothetical protein